MYCSILSLSFFVTSHILDSSAFQGCFSQLGVTVTLSQAVFQLWGGTPQASQELMPPLRPARGPTAALSCQAIRLVNIPQINSGSIIKPHCYLIPQRLGRLLYQDCKLQRAMSAFFFNSGWPILYQLEQRLKKDGSFGKGLNLYCNTSLVRNQGVFYWGTTYRAALLVVLPQSSSLFQWTTLKIMGCKLPS